MMPPTVRDREVSKNGVCCVESVGAYEVQVNAKTLDIPCPCWIVLAVSYTSELRLLLTTTSRLFSLQNCNSPSFPVSLHCKALFQPIFDAASGRDMRLTKHPRCIFTPPPERLGCEDGQTHCHWPLATGHWPATGPACLSPPKSSIGLDGMS